MDQAESTAPAQTQGQAQTRLDPALYPLADSPTPLALRYINNPLKRTRSPSSQSQKRISLDSTLGLSTPLSRDDTVDPLSLPSPSLSPITSAKAHDYFSYNNAMQIPAMVDTFEALPDSLKDYVMYQFLRRCSKKSLSIVASAVIPALRCDFLAHLPQELVANILQYLDVKSLCVATQVSRTWKQIIDGSFYTWRKLLMTDGFNLQPGEMNRAISQGWSMQGWNHINAPRNPGEPPALLKLPEAYPNMYKSIYRRRYLINKNWMNPNSTPNHLSFPGHGRDVVTCLQFDSQKIITGSDDLSINVYDTKTGHLRARLDGHEGGVWALQYAGNTIVSGSTDRTVRVWNIQKAKCTQVFYGHTSTVRCLQIMHPVRTGTAPDGKPIMEPSQPIVVTGSRDSTIRIWKLPLDTDDDYLPESQPDDPGMYFLRVLQGHTHSVRAISGHGDMLVSGSYDTFVRVWKISTGECLFRLAGHGAKVYSVVIDPDRTRCISGSMDWLVKVWSLETGSCLYTLDGHTSLVGLLELDHASLVSAAADATLRVWDPKTGAFRHKLDGHAGAITCFQHDEYKVVSGSEGALKLWDIKTGKHVKDLLSDVNRVWQVRFDDRRCVAAVQRGTETFIEVLNFDYDPDKESPTAMSEYLMEVSE